MKNYQSFLSENVQFMVAKFSIYLNRRVFVMYFLLKRSPIRRDIVCRNRDKKPPDVVSLVKWPTVYPAPSIYNILFTSPKTYLYNFNPLKPHFYIVKPGFTGVYIIFSYFCSINIDCGYSLEPPRRGGSNEYPQFMF